MTVGVHAEDPVARLQAAAGVVGADVLDVTAQVPAHVAQGLAPTPVGGTLDVAGTGGGGAPPHRRAGRRRHAAGADGRRARRPAGPRRARSRGPDRLTAVVRP